MGNINSKKNYAVVVGGTNIDILGIPKKGLIYHDSNIGNVKTSLGGVGRNIAENLSRLSVDTHLVSIIGDDSYGDLIIESSKEIGLNLDNSLVLEGENTSIYLSILDGEGDMEVALSSMDMFEKMDIGFIKSKKKLIEESKVCIIDTNVPKDTIEYILKNFKGTDFFLDTVSTEKAKKVKDLIGLFHTVKPNKIEAEILTGIEIKTDDDLKKAIEYFHSKGVKNVFISLSKDGVIFSDGKNIDRLKVKDPSIINATGAGDAFIAALSYGHMRGLDIREKARLGVGASLLALSHENTINPNMSVKNIDKKLEEVELC
ncbi:carbohydrate kinase family protein [Tissierella creatinophila]|uniref:Pseudouridine kinase n=1 Tax=Tissierella creatinophila DSM 6911 TaxID=1123403 RepID=A0A1U7M383_TISCR|nr:carbohydrate kinase family protein [Tissierella creatinophila]OLS01783.1 pseudouridine kinase [Tissierella creatinophila DSM 6911]